jgi:hypothetical protein
VNHETLNQMKTKLFRPIFALILLGLLAGTSRAQMLPPGGKFGPTNTPLDSWSFRDSTGWTNDNGYAPVSFTNLNYSYLGNGSSLVVDTNLPAWLQYNVFESDGTTNLTVDSGTVMFWFAPSWSSTNQGGFGPGDSGGYLKSAATRRIQVTAGGAFWWMTAATTFISRRRPTIYPAA